MPNNKAAQSKTHCKNAKRHFKKPHRLCVQAEHNTISFLLRMVGQLVAVSAKGPENWFSARASDAVIKKDQGAF